MGPEHRRPAPAGGSDRQLVAEQWLPVEIDVERSSREPGVSPGSEDGPMTP